MSENIYRLSFNLPPYLGDYYYWLQVNRWNKNQEHYYTEILLKECAIQPLISIIIPVYNTRTDLVEKTINSVKAQLYTNWEIIIVDDGSTNVDLVNQLDMYECSYIHVHHIKNSGISAATNYGVAHASGEFIGFLDHDDLLHPAALTEIILAYNQDSNTELFYTDDDKIDNFGRRYDPQFKPDFSPEYLLSHMYIGHFLVVKSSLFRDVNGFESKYDGAQDYAFVLKCLCEKENIVVKHIPKILYHWRASENSLAYSADAKPESIDKGRQAIEEFVNKQRDKFNLAPITCSQYDWAELSKCGYYKLNFSNDGPEVTIVIPIKDKVELLIACLNSIKIKTTYTNYKIIVINNGSQERKTLNYLKSLENIKVINIETDSFNFSYINNQAVQEVNTEYVLFLNNDTKILNPDWLTNMIGYAQFSNVGAVGARLIYPDGLIQHAGIVNGIETKDGNIVKPLLQGQYSCGGTYLCAEKLVRNVSGVTAACLLTKKSTFLEVGGFDEVNYSVAYNDPDFCMKLLNSGYRIVYCPDTHIIHYEGKTREHKKDDIENDINYKIEYRELYGRDPFYNKNLDLYSSAYKINSKHVVTDEKFMFSFTVAAFSYNLQYEGSSFSQYELLSGLSKISNIKFIVYCTQDGPLRKAYEDVGIKVKVVPSILGTNFNYYIYKEGLKRLKEDLKKEGVHVMYANTLQTFYGIDAANDLLIPSLWNIRESEPIDSYFSHFGQPIAFRALECFFYTYRNIFVSHSSRSMYEKFNCKNNFEVIHNGLSTERLNTNSDISINVDKEDTVYICVGTVCERKNQIDTLKALSLFTEEEMCGIKVVFIGLRKSLKYYEQFMDVYNTLPKFVQDKISLVEETDAVVPYYLNSHVLIFNSLVESYPRVILEALYFSLGIITTPVNGVVEQVSDLVADFYTPKDFSKLKELILKYKSKKYLYEKRNLSSKQLMSLMSYSEMLNRYRSLFIEAYLSGVTR